MTYQSVKSQDFKSFEWLVIDGASKDKTTNFLSSINDNFFSFISEADDGIYDAMNKGVKMASGQYIVFMNSGDTFYSESVLNIVNEKLLSSLYKPDVLYGGAVLSFSQRVTYYRRPLELESSIWHGLPANHQATYYRRNLINKIPYKTEYTLCSDYYLSAVLSLHKCKSILLDKPLTFFKPGGSSSTKFFPLFYQPYLIQRDVLKRNLISRITSIAKRFAATLVFQMLILRVALVGNTSSLLNLRRTGK